MYVEEWLVSWGRLYPRWEDRRRAMAEAMQTDAQDKYRFLLDRRIDIQGTLRSGPLLVCERGARLRNLDLKVAAADCRHFWKTGQVPLRATPVKNPRQFWSEQMRFWRSLLGRRATTAAPLGSSGEEEARRRAREWWEALATGAGRDREHRCDTCSCLMRRGEGFLCQPRGVFGASGAAHGSKAIFETAVKKTNEFLATTPDLICAACFRREPTPAWQGRLPAVEPSESDCRAILSAAAEGDDKRLEDLLQRRNLSPDFFYSEDRITPLIAASRQGHVKCMTLILKNTAALDTTNKDGVTALMAAAFGCHVDAVRMLIKAGAVIDKRAPNGTTALTIAAERDEHTVLELLNAGANPNVALDDGSTPLTLARDAGSQSIVNALLRSGARK